MNKYFNSKVLGALVVVFVAVGEIGMRCRGFLYEVEIPNELKID